LLFADNKAKPADGDPRNLIFTTDTQYSISPEGDRHHQREVARKINLEEMRIAAQQELEEQIAHELANPDEQTAKALAILDEEHRMSVQGQIASQSYLAKERQRADQVAREMIAGEDFQAAGITDSDHLVTPTIEEPAPEWSPQPKPRRMKMRYIKRGSVWCRAKKVKHPRPGEDVWIRNGPDDFEKSGVVNRHGHLPASPYLEDKI
jgi:hypothetical protein